jgi:hypothetical protein
MFLTCVAILAHTKGGSRSRVCAHRNPTRLGGGDKIMIKVATMFAWQPDSACTSLGQIWKALACKLGHEVELLSPSSPSFNFYLWVG